MILSVQFKAVPVMTDLFFQVPGARPSSASQPRQKPVYGRKQFSNAVNNPSAGAPKAVFGSYTQNVGTISASSLAALQGKKPWGILTTGSCAV